MVAYEREKIARSTPAGISQESGSPLSCECAARPSGEARTIVYTYDGLYRLTNARECDGLLSSAACVATTAALEYRYAYELMGNRTRAETIMAGAAQLTKFTYNIANQLISDGAQSFSYNPNGRLISAGNRAR